MEKKEFSNFWNFCILSENIDLDDLLLNMSDIKKKSLQFRLHIIHVYTWSSKEFNCKNETKHIHMYVSPNIGQKLLLNQ